MKYFAPLLALFWSLSAANAQIVVPTPEEPSHRVVLEKENLKILDIAFPPGSTSLYHSHNRPIHFVILSMSLMREQILGQAWSPMGPGGPLPDFTPEIGMSKSHIESTTKPKTHRVANVGETMFHVIAVINMGPGVDDAANNPKSTTIATDKPLTNRWYRSRPLDIAPATATEWQTTNKDIMVVKAKPGSLVITHKGAEQTRIEMDTWMLIEKGTTYQFKNTGKGSVSVVMVEVR